MLDPKHWHPKYRPVSLNIAVIAGLSLIGWRLICGTPESVIVDVLWYIGLSLLEFTAAIIAFRVIKRGESLTFPYHILKKPSTSATFR
jgi:hypothetical protein